MERDRESHRPARNLLSRRGVQCLEPRGRFDGQGDWMIEGQPVRQAKTGDSIIIPSGVIHNVRNTGVQPLKVMAAFVVEKGKTLTTPAP